MDDKHKCTDTHRCPGCETMADHILACKPHWYQVSTSTRPLVNRLWLAAREDAVKETNT